MANNLLPAATTTTILLLLLFSPPPISSTSTTTTTTTTTDTDSTVLDYFGNPVEAGKKYYFFFGGVGYFFGSLTTTSRPNQPKCPQYVIVSPIPSDFGPGVEFLPSDQTNKTISLSSNLNIVFSGSTPCSGKPVWRMTRNEANGGLYVTTDGVIGDETMSKSWFSIEKGVDDSLSSLVFYRVRYCPGGENDVVCGYLGLFYGDVDYNIWLTLGLEPADPFRVSFWPASVKPPASISHAHGLRARATAR